MVTVGLMRIDGPQVPISSSLNGQPNLLSPAVLLYRSGKCELRTLTARLAGVTGLQEEEMLQKVRDAAAEALEPSAWTQVDAQRVLNAVGTVGTPKYLDCRRVPGKSQITFRMANGEGPTVQEVKYSAKRSRGRIDLKAALRDEAITIPKGMYMLLPAALAEDSKGLVVVVSLLNGKLKEIKELEKDEAEPASSKAVETTASDDQAELDGE